MEFPFPLLEPRQGDRHYYDTASSLHHCSLDIPEARGGRVRLQLTIPWYDLEKDLQVLTLAIVWPKHGPALPGPNAVAETIWKRLTAGDFERTRRSSRPLFWSKHGPPRAQPSGLVTARVRINKWRGETFVRTEDQDLAKSLPRDDAVVCLVCDLGWAFRFFHGRWPRDKDKLAWVYRAHRMTALLVAEEIADLYLQNSPHLLPRQRQNLDDAYPVLKKRIAEAYRSDTVTPRRLALALVDIKFEKLLNRLLDPNRMVGLDDATLWSRLLPQENRERLNQLRPAPSVWEIMSWAERVREENEAASGFSSWYSCLVGKPLEPLNPPFETDIRQRKEIAFLEYPGVERWASIVWEALNS